LSLPVFSKHLPHL